MRSNLVLLPLLLCATPALAQAPPPPERQVPRELTDPATVDKLSNAMQGARGSFLNLPVGEIQAAMEGRQATPADQRMTVRSESKVSDRELRRQIAEAKPMMQQGMRQLTAALPAMMKSMEEMEQAVERAATNLPDPTYPKHNSSLRAQRSNPAVSGLPRRLRLLAMTVD